MIQSAIRTKPTLRIDASGITFADYPCAVGHIPWSNVRGARIQSVITGTGTRFLVVDVVDKNAVLSPLPAWKRVLLRSNADYFSTPVFIHAKDVSVPLEEAQAAIEAALLAYHSQTTVTVPAAPRIAIPLRAGRA